MASQSPDDFPIKNYMVLQPEELGILDLFHIIFSHDIHKRKFVDCPEEKKENLEHRFLIFFSVLAQKFLLSVAKPMSWFGSKVELLLNHPLWRVKKPERTSATFLSVVGNLDTRVELDKSIEHGDDRYYPALSAMASKIAYENEAFVTTTVRDHWKMGLIGYYNFWNDFQGKPTTQTFMLRDKNEVSDMIVVAFRGTEPFDADAWSTDIDISWVKFPKVGKIHGGFMKALGLPKEALLYSQKKQGWPKEVDDNRPSPLAYYAIREKLKELFEANKDTKFILTGHSLGGALAILFAAVLVIHKEVELLERLEGVYTFGQPRVGDKKFGKFMTKQLEEHVVRYVRFVYSNDVVPRLPTDDKTFLFKHFGACLYYNSFYKGKILPEEPNKNFKAWIAVHLNAIWELLRSFISSYLWGSDYGEGFLIKLSRVIGLLFPGIVAHSPREYVNATRLESKNIYLPLPEKLN